MGLALLELTVSVEDCFGIEITDTENIYRTCGDFHGVVVRTLRREGKLCEAPRLESGKWTEDQVWIEIRKMISKMHVPFELITKEAHFHKDLGLD